MIRNITKYPNENNIFNDFILTERNPNKVFTENNILIFTKQNSELINHTPNSSLYYADSKQKLIELDVIKNYNFLLKLFLDYKLGVITGINLDDKIYKFNDLIDYENFLIDYYQIDDEHKKYDLTLTIKLLERIIIRTFNLKYVVKNKPVVIYLSNNVKVIIDRHFNNYNVNISIDNNVIKSLTNISYSNLVYFMLVQLHILKII